VLTYEPHWASTNRHGLDQSSSPFSKSLPSLEILIMQVLIIFKKVFKRWKRSRKVSANVRPAVAPIRNSVLLVPTAVTVVESPASNDQCRPLFDFANHLEPGPPRSYLVTNYPVVGLPHQDCDTRGSPQKGEAPRSARIGTLLQRCLIIGELAIEEMHEGSLRPIDTRMREIQAANSRISAHERTLKGNPTDEDLDHIEKSLDELDRSRPWLKVTYSPQVWPVLPRYIRPGPTYHEGRLRGQDWGEENIGGRAVWVRQGDDGGPYIASGYI
jgi:hypothetical protein